MRFHTPLLFLSSAATTLGQDVATPQPKLVVVSYWGSACPQGGLSAVVGTVSAATNIAALNFTMSNFLPTLGSFGSSLRMCSIVSTVTIDKGWKVAVNARGTKAQGNADVPGNATMFLRSTYAFAEKAEVQSIGMLDVKGPLTGQFARLLTPADGDKGAEGLCGGGELDIEFQARAVEDINSKRRRRGAADEKSWTLTTDIDVIRC